MKILLASGNAGKAERFRKLLRLVDTSIELCSPDDFKIDCIEVEETEITLAGNAELKARAYEGKVSVPILANDTGFYVEGDGLIEAPKRTALAGVHEKDLSPEEITKRVLKFWKGVATKHGGKVDAAWVEVFVVMFPDGSIKKVDSRREVLLTNKEFGVAHSQMPMRALYISKITNKPAIFHTEEEEFLEMSPIVEALKKVLRN